MTLSLPGLSAFALLCATSASVAGVIYEWTDAGGQVHLSDAVPEKYKGAAKRVDTSRYRIPAAEQDEAQRQASRLKARAASMPVDVRAPEPTTRPRAAPAAQGGASLAASSASDCVSWRRRFAVSRDCFAGFQLPDGSLRPGAFQTCGDDVPNPEPACGPQD